MKKYIETMIFDPMDSIGLHNIIAILESQIPTLTQCAASWASYAVT